MQPRPMSTATHSGTAGPCTNAASAHEAAGQATPAVRHTPCKAAGARRGRAPRSRQPFRRLQRDAMRYRLLDFKAKGVERVRIAAGQDGVVCPRRAAQAGRVLTVDEALDEMPLPVRRDDAGRKVRLEHSRGWCRCLYVRQG